MSQEPADPLQIARAGLDELLRDGRITAAQIADAERVWRERLAAGIRLPTGAQASIDLPVLYHVLADPRIARKPERIERILQSVFEIRTANQGRRRALSRWDEQGVQVAGYAILSPNDEVVTVHVVDERTMARFLRQGDSVWRS